MIKPKQHMMKSKLTYLLSTFLLIFLTKYSVFGQQATLSGFNLAEQQYKLLAATHTDLTKYPRSADPNGKTSFTDIKDWTGGFWPGCLWYLYEYSSDPYWKEQALKWTKSLETNQYNTNHHDIGFVMNSSYGNAYRLLGDTSFKSIIIQSAKSLLTRFNPKVGAIKSWDRFQSWDGKNSYEYPVIIDNMMNLELLFLASKLSGDNIYKEVAIKHAETTLKHQYRKDFSSYHVINYDPKTGEVLSKETAQGFSDNSAWARGQAWGLYGFVLMYRETGHEKYLDAATKMAEFYQNHPRLPEDKIPLWDFDVNQTGYQPDWNYNAEEYKVIPRDASAAAITASALIELSDYVSPEKQLSFLKLSEEILQSLATETYSNKVGKNGFFLLNHSVGSLPHKGEIDVPLVYADYYYLEALHRWNNRKNKSKIAAATLPTDGKILFLGNSITYAGDYVAMLESMNHLVLPKNQLSYINLGLPSETVSGLSEENHADGKFPRPYLFDRIESVLNQISADIVFVCYGMNDGIYLPLDENRFNAYKKGVERLSEKLNNAGVKRIIWLTPPVHDDFEKRLGGYNLVLDHYGIWLKEKAATEGWEVIDIHFPMRSYLEGQIETNESFKLADDGVHPAKQGHWLMAREILKYFNPEAHYAIDWKEQLRYQPKLYNVFQLVSKKQSILKDAWLTKTGHKRPGIPKGLPINEAVSKAAMIDKQLNSEFIEN